MDVDNRPRVVKEMCFILTVWNEAPSDFFKSDRLDKNIIDMFWIPRIIGDQRNTKKQSILVGNSGF